MIPSSEGNDFSLEDSISLLYAGHIMWSVNISFQSVRAPPKTHENNDHITALQKTYYACKQKIIDPNIYALLLHYLITTIASDRIGLGYRKESMH